MTYYLRIDGDDEHAVDQNIADLVRDHYAVGVSVGSANQYVLLGHVFAIQAAIDCAIRAGMTADQVRTTTQTALNDGARVGLGVTARDIEDAIHSQVTNGIGKAEREAFVRGAQSSGLIGDDGSGAAAPEWR